VNDQLYEITGGQSGLPPRTIRTLGTAGPAMQHHRDLMARLDYPSTWVLRCHRRCGRVIQVRRAVLQAEAEAGRTVVFICADGSVTAQPSSAATYRKR